MSALPPIISLESSGGLGRRIPTDFGHVEKHAFSVMKPKAPKSVEKVLNLPHWHHTHDQGEEGACVGFGTSFMMAVVNTDQNVAESAKTKTVRYNPWWLWNHAKMIDDWSDTNPGDENGTTVRAACEVVRASGLVAVTPVKAQPEYEFEETDALKPDEASGIQAYRWATTVDEMRAAMSLTMPMAIGVNWYEAFDHPTEGDHHGQRVDWWIGREGDLGNVRGGHCVCVYGASDKRQAFRIKNSWGPAYPEVWMPYKAMERLINEEGEVALVTDK